MLQRRAEKTTSMRVSWSGLIEKQYRMEYPYASAAAVHPADRALLPRARKNLCYSASFGVRMFDFQRVALDYSLVVDAARRKQTKRLAAWSGLRK